ncbi:hypothetical protein K3N28_12040 [Glycomyces sp. TRM65418]|uniref:hypothetical protein n=1 Tax=Glycomyces sp. TRM65418 TaxID=2867006 RepID=UPI001CE582D5|nr:hypothetical protein [Glycomyces sp. TRM65418]MCC3763797.1 hypothetical protein [Glycomyces sp. TRM65418]QZD53505.1 hypothetical protein K3N28_11975 [Glycomyces sp. TRM65418]
MSGTNRAAGPQPQRRPASPEEHVPVPELPAAYGTATPVEWDPVEDAPPPAVLGAQRGSLGTQADGMAAIRAVWERAAESDRHRPARPGRLQPRREPRRFAPALLGILVCACLLMFFAWTAAPALWMTMGHSQAGTVQVTTCENGFAPSCTGRFRAADWSKEVHLTGEVDVADLGRELPARTTGPDAHSAYVGGNAGLVLRWAPSMVLFMASAFALVAASGATRLYDGRSKAVGLCWFAAGAVLAVTLAFAW